MNQPFRPAPELASASSTSSTCRGRRRAIAGIEQKTLLFDKSTGLLTALMRMAPGARLPDHEHVKIEQTYVLEGESALRRGRICKAGQFVWRPAGSRHEAWAGPQGGIFLAMFQIPNKFFGPRRARDRLSRQRLAEVVGVPQMKRVFALAVSC